MYSLTSRIISLVLASGLASLILIMPQVLTNLDGSPNHSLLMLLMLGIMIGFIHGVGFQPKPIVLRYSLSPIISWSIMIGGVLYIINKTGIL